MRNIEQELLAGTMTSNSRFERAVHRSLFNPQRVWQKLQNVLTTEQFLCAVKVEVGKLQDFWASAGGIPAAKAKELLNQTLGDLVIELQSAPSLVRVKF